MGSRQGVGSQRRKIYILKDEELRIEIIWLYHDILVARYRGR